MAASLWRKKLVLHRSLVEILIGLSESPIMHAPVPRSREISSAQREEITRRRSLTTASRRRRSYLSGTIPPDGEGWWWWKELKNKRKSFLDFLM
jgi:hypothetical protein